MKTSVRVLLMGMLAGSAMAAEISSPTEIADCVLWLDAGQGVTESGGAVSAWADQSPSGDSLEQAVANRQPALVAGAVNGRPAISFSKGPSAPADSDYLALLVIDADANGGDGAGSVYVQNWTAGGLLEPVVGLQDVDLKLWNMDSGTHDTRRWDSLYMRMAGGGATIDDIVVIHEPPPGGTLFIIR